MRASGVGGWQQESFSNSSASPSLPLTSLLFLQVFLLPHFTRHLFSLPFLYVASTYTVFPISQPLSFGELSFTVFFFSCNPTLSSHLLSDIITDGSSAPTIQSANDVTPPCVFYSKYTHPKTSMHAEIKMPAAGGAEGKEEKQFNEQTIK